MISLIILVLAAYALYYFMRSSQTKETGGIGKDDAVYMSTEQFARRLEYFADLPEYQDEKETYLALASSLRNGTMPRPRDSGVVTPATTVVGMENTVLPAGIDQHAPFEAPRNTPLPQSPRPTVSETLQNINVLLYLGAFLVLVSVGIFVGVNFDLLGPGFKFTLLILFTATFYLSGLAMDLKSQRLRPAGRTFIGIGLIALPFCGVAAYSLFELASPYSVALVTSLIALIVYVVTLVLTRHIYLNYLVMMSALTSVESGLLVFDLGLPVMAWTAVAVAMVFMLVGRYSPADDGSFMLGAQLLAPASLFISFVSWTMGNQSAGELGILCLLAAVFYALATVIDKSDTQRQLWIAMAFGLFAASGVLILLELDVGRSFWAAWLLGLGVIYGLTVRVLPVPVRESAGSVAAVTAAFAPLSVYDSPGLLNIYLAGLSLAGLWQYYHSRIKLPAFIAALAVLLLPFSVLVYWLEAAPLTASLFGFLSYLTIGLAAFYLRWFASSSEYVRRLSLGVAATAWSLGWLWTVFQYTDWLLMVSSVSVAALVLLVASQEKQASLIGLATGMTYIAAVQFSSIFDLDPAITLTLVGTLIYMLGFSGVLRETEAGLWSRVSGIGGPLLAVIFGDSVYLQISGLFMTSVLVGAEAKLRRSAEVAYVSAAGFVLVVLWLLYELGVTEAQVYFQLPALYFAAIAAHLGYRNLSEQRNAAAVAALFLATVPLGLQSMSAGGEIRGLLQVVLSVFLVLIGMAIGYALVWRWGAVTLVLTVLYQLRHVLYAVPKYIVSLTLGMVLIGIAIAVLLKRGGDAEN